MNILESSKRIFAAVAVVVLMAGGPASAGAVDHQKCSKTFDACLKDCDSKFAEDTTKRAACVPGCSARYAACDAGVAYEKVKPWLEEQAEKTKKFLDELTKDLNRDKPTESKPKDKGI